VGLVVSGEQWAAVIVAVVVITGIQVIVRRQMASGHRRWTWVHALPTLGFQVAIVGVGAYVIRFQAIIGVFLIAIGTVTILLQARAIAKEAERMGEPEDRDHQIDRASGPSFDLLIWKILVLPMVLVVVLIVLALTGHLG
jgi:hypothetical protein